MKKILISILMIFCICISFVYGEINEIEDILINDFGISFAEVDESDVPIADIPYNVNEQDAWKFEYTNMNLVWSQLDDIPYLNNIIVAVIDSGVKLDHPDLNILPNGYDFYGNDGTGDDDPSDHYGHGTHIAGIIGAKRDNGMDNVVGVAPNVQILPIKASTDAGAPSGYAVAEGIDYAIEQGADVISLSIVNSYYGTEYLGSAIARAEAAGVVVVGASGNFSNHWLDNEIYHTNYTGYERFSKLMLFPAAYNTVISVGAVRKLSYLDEVGIADYSNIGGDINNEYKRLDVVAPGAYIRSSNLHDVNTARVKYGTSMAAPFVAGEVALLLGKYPDLSPAQIRDIVRSTADDSIVTIPAGYIKEDAIGSGLIDYNKALNFSPLKTLNVLELADFVYSFDTFDYNHNINFNQSSLTLDGTLMDGAIVSIEGDSFTNLMNLTNLTNQIIPLEMGMNNIKITAELPSEITGDPSIAVRTYNLNVNRISPVVNDIVFKSGAVELTTSFDPDVLDQTIVFEDALTAVEVVPTVGSGLDFLIDGLSVPSKIYTISSIATDITVDVFSAGETAADGVTYNLTLMSEDYKLDNLTLDGVTIPNFDPEIFNYDLGVYDFDSSQFVFNASKNAVDKTVDYALNNLRYNGDFSDVDIPMDMIVGPNVIEWFVYNAEHANIYTILLERDDGIDLNSVGVVGKSDANASILPIHDINFDKEVLSYDVKLPFEATSIEFDVDRESDSVVSIQYGSEAYVEFDTSGIWSHALTLGDNIVRIKNEIGIGTPEYAYQIYEFHVTKYGNSKIASLEMSCYNDLNQQIPSLSLYDFSSNVLDYYVDLSSTTKMVRIIIEKDYELSEVYASIDEGPYTLVTTNEITMPYEADKMVKIKCEYTPQSMVTIYTLNLNKVDAATISNASLIIDSADVLNFDRNIIDYDIIIEPDITEMEINFSVLYQDYTSLMLFLNGTEMFFNVLEFNHTFNVTGDDLFVILSEAMDGTYKVHRIHVRHRPLSSDGGIGQILIKSLAGLPATQAGISEYYAVVDQDTTDVEIQIEAVDANSLISFDCSDFIYNNQSIFTVNLEDPTTLLVIKILAEDGTQSAYTFVIYKDQGGSTFEPLPPPPPVIITNSVSVTLDTDAIVLDYGSSANAEFISYDFTETVVGADNDAVFWTLSDNTYVEVDINGVVTARDNIPVGTGDVVVTLTVNTVIGGATATADILFEEKTPLGAIKFNAPYISGYPDGTFRPKLSVTRAEVATMFATILNLNVDNPGIQVFDDVSENQWSYPYVQAMYRTGIFAGYLENDGRVFKPNDPISRAEIAQVFTNYWLYNKIDVGGESLTEIPDVSKDYWAFEPINRLYNTTIFTGYLNGAYRPYDDTIRQHLVNMINKLIGRPPVISEEGKFSDVPSDYVYFGDIEAASSFYFEKIDQE